MLDFDCLLSAQILRVLPRGSVGRLNVAEADELFVVIILLYELVFGNVLLNILVVAVSLVGWKSLAMRRRQV